MVWIDPKFKAPTIPEDEKYQGTELDANILKGKAKNPPLHLTVRDACRVQCTHSLQYYM